MMKPKGRFGPLIGAIDEGTSSVRFIIFCSRTSEIITFHQIPLKGIFPQEGWVEQDPKEIISLVNECIECALQKLVKLEVDPSDIVTVGITNQRETAVVWDKTTGEPLHNTLVWSDMRTQSLVARLRNKLPNKNGDHWKVISGLPLTPAFSAVKYRWLLEEVPEVKKAAENNSVSFGTIDSWLLYNLTGGKNGGVFITDCTNASRTLLMDLKSLAWSPELCEFFGIKSEWLPDIRSSSEIYGYIADGPLKGVPISGCLGDQQAALLGQMCVEEGQTKNTYGTGCFVLRNIGRKKIDSKHGLLTTVAFKLGANAAPMYALEGSVAVAGAALNWLKALGILNDTNSVDAMAEAVTETNDVYFVPAFSGLYAPYWQQDARGIIVGLREDTKDTHIVRAALEAVCFQTRDVLEAMEKDCKCPLKELLVDGGMTKNNLMMQLQADLTGIPVVRQSNGEMTALGVAMAAGMAEGINVWNFERMTPIPSKIFKPSITEKDRNLRYVRWKEAVERSLNWDT